MNSEEIEALRADRLAAGEPVIDGSEFLTITEMASMSAIAHSSQGKTEEIFLVKLTGSRPTSRNGDFVEEETQLAFEHSAVLALVANAQTYLDEYGKPAQERP